MKELLLHGYNLGVKGKVLEKITLTSSKEDVLYKLLADLSQKDLEPKMEGIRDYLDKKPSYLVGLSTMTTPVLIYTNKQTKTKFNEHYVKDKFLICNNENWIKQLFFLGNNIEEYDDDYKETLEKLLSKARKSFSKLIENISNEQLKGLVLNKGRNGSLKATEKRVPISLTGSFEAYPIVYLWGYSLGLLAYSKEKLVKITYRRLDGNERIHYYSNNTNTIFNIYNDSDIAEILTSLGEKTLNLSLFNQKISTSIFDGLLQIPDLSLPKNTDMFSRKITLSAIESIEDVSNSEEELKYLKQLVQVDTGNVMANFQYHFPNISEQEKEILISKFELNPDSPIDSSLNLKDSIETTAFRIKLHNHMLEQQEEYPNYTGIIKDNNSINLDNVHVGTLKTSNDEDLEHLDL